MRYTDVLILGAGCAGTSLAHHLEAANFSGQITLLDKRTDFSQAQSWCSWSEIPATMQPLIRRRWHQWQVRDQYQVIKQKSAIYSYQQIPAPQFYRHFHQGWQKSDSPTRLLTGENVRRIEAHENYVRVTTNHDEWQAKTVFDARHRGSENLKKSKNHRSTFLQQSFLGWNVEFAAPVFDSQTAVIMDFRVADSNAIHFLYVLPDSPSRALVESTSFAISAIDRERHERVLRTYLSENFGHNYHIETQESGELPMTTVHFKFKLEQNFYTIGVAGGHARPSSGYAFHRIQRHTRQIAHSIVNNQPLTTRSSGSKYTLLDAVFLEIMRMKPDLAQKSFLTLFERVTPDALVRFLSEISSWQDDLEIISVLPKIPFGCAALRKTFERFLLPPDEPTSSKITVPNALLRSVG